MVSHCLMYMCQHFTDVIYDIKSTKQCDRVWIILTNILKDFPNIY